MQISLSASKIYHLKIVFNYCLILFPLLAQAQFVTHGPVVGAVTDSSARVYVRTKVPMEFTMEYYCAGQPYQYYDVATTAALDNSAILNLTGLKSNTLYSIKFLFPQARLIVIDDSSNNREENAPLIIDSIHGSFQTFPKPGEKGDFLFVTGSCQESVNMKTFDVMASLKPRMLLHSGDFTYPSYQMGDDYPVKYTAVQESFRRRYQENRMREMLWNVPIAYTPDDDDAWGAARVMGITGVGYAFEKRGKKEVLVNKLRMDSFPDIMRSNCMRGYVEYFPGYELQDSSDGFYHSFVMGNIEFIFLDTRFSGDCNGLNLKYDSLANRWSFAPDSNIHIISVEQMEWLKQKLKNSTADWKFLVMGLPFNQNLRHLIDLGIKSQDILAGGAGEKGTGFKLVTSFSSYWAGFPYQSKELLDFITANNIKDVIVVSGDTHHNVMDDGTNGGLPELNASGLAVAGTHLAYYMNKLGKLMGYPRYDKFAWNQGGGGLGGNKNFKNQFGKIEVVKDEYVQLSVVDEDSVTLASFKVVHSSKQPAIVKHKVPHYNKKLNRWFKRKRPTLWMSFAKFLGKMIFKQK